MWFIFLIACIVVALAALLVILIGSVVVKRQGDGKKIFRNG